MGKEMSFIFGDHIGSMFIIVEVVLVSNFHFRFKVFDKPPKLESLLLKG